VPLGKMAYFIVPQRLIIWSQRLGRPLMGNRVPPL